MHCFPQPQITAIYIYIFFFTKYLSGITSLRGNLYKEGFVVVVVIVVFLFLDFLKMGISMSFYK